MIVLTIVVLTDLEYPVLLALPVHYDSLGLLRVDETVVHQVKRCVTNFRKGKVEFVF